ncbi:hypothetical protein [Candidatus Korarchaeum cryptofilum]|uniref:Uncharacterized protein n=1 Tax=Korarchaeum cryptofilum (strain OPF8) TaxID=374847 RepID=B1L5J7_KORCO|nr:hypothetical protein [Candidatus Korarchaeum cryptofilum]ACB07726.1 hypothetical protein Kcr_0980 [Candidatus Korarchaeum cryptofilum OPF8]
MIGSLRKEFEEAKKLAAQDEERALSIIREISIRTMKLMAPEWDCSISLAEYSATRGYPDFFLEMADRIEDSFKFCLEGSQLNSIIASAAFLLKVAERLHLGAENESP